MTTKGMAVFGALLLAGYAAGGDTHYVLLGNPSAAHPHTNWTTAAASLDDGLAAADPGDEVWVSSGVYHPTNRRTGFALKNSIGLYGGFAGGETNRPQRDNEANLTVLSGDMDRNDETNGLGYVGSAISTNALRGSNSYHVVSWASSAGATNTVDGFTISAGRGRDDPPVSFESDADGGGIHTTGTGVLHVRNCRIAGNRTGYDSYGGQGAGIRCHGELVVSNCVIQGNCTAPGNLEGGHGGGLAVSRSVTMIDTVVVSNRTGDAEFMEGYGGMGAGFLALAGATVRGCTIRGNITGAGPKSGGDAAGGYANELVVMSDCVVTDNQCGTGGTGGHGGGLLCSEGLAATQTVFTGNSAGDGVGTGGGGGGFFSMRPTRLVGCTVVSNTAGTGDDNGGDGGGFVCLIGGLLVSNTVIRENTAGDARTGGSASGGRGGGFYAERPAVVVYSTIGHNQAGAGCPGPEDGCGGGVFAFDTLEVRNSLLCGNAAGGGDGGSDMGGSGGAIYGSGDITLIATTIVGNRAGEDTDGGHGGGVYLGGGADIYNSILSGNTVGAGCWGPDLFRSSSDSVNVHHSVVAEPHTNSVNGAQISVFDWDVATISFVASTNDDYELKYGSPCIGAGTNAYANDATDLAGKQRVIGSRVDIGTYEYDIATADSNRDGVPDAWYVAYGLDPTNAGTGAANADSDPHSNRDEWVADTNPTNSQSCLRIAAISNGASRAVCFTSSSSRVYALKYSTNLVTGPWTIVPGKTNVAGLGGWDRLSDTNTTDAVRYYRLSVSIP